MKVIRDVGSLILSALSTEPCPSQEFQSLLAKILLDDESRSTKFLDSLMNQLNWSFSEFVGIIQDVSFSHLLKPRFLHWTPGYQSVNLTVIKSYNIQYPVKSSVSYFLFFFLLELSYFYKISRCPKLWLLFSFFLLSNCS